MISLLAALASILLLIVVGRVLFSVPIPRQFFGFDAAVLVSGGLVSGGRSGGPGGLAGRDGGFGLTAMRQRLDQIGGTLEIESEPGTGTAVSASVPAWGPAVSAQHAGVGASVD